MEGQHNGKGQQSDRNGSNNPDSQKKGKEKESMADRLQASVNMAAQAMASSQGLSNTSSSSRGKATTPFTNSSTTYGGPSNVLQETSTSRTATLSAGPGSSLRTQRNLEETSDDFSYFIDGPSSAWPMEKTDSTIGAGSTLKGESVSTGGSVAEAEAMDGSAVINLLSLPDDEDVMSPQEGDISPETIANLRSALFDHPSSGQRLPWDSLLNFTPHFVSLDTSPADAKLHLGTADENVVRSTWIHQWDDVLSAYTDEVWGDLAALASEARREIKEVEEGGLEGMGAEKSALGRLRMILAHVRGS